MSENERQVEALGAMQNQPPVATPPDPPLELRPPPPVAPIPPQFRPVRPMGRRYGFLCSYCSSRLEATENMAGQSGTCPTCGNQILIPILDHRGRLIDPTSGQIIKQDPHPVHAYAAAGHRAPSIIMDASGENKIRCPRCQRHNLISANNCAGCGLPFTMDGTIGDAISGNNTWAVASLVLGIVTMVGGMLLIVPPILALVFGFVAMRGNSSTQQSGNGLAIAGIIMGAIGGVISIFFYLRTLS
jgi:DNA-directed RNA polymerase subunit RPC12/RpoP